MDQPASEQVHLYCFDFESSAARVEIEAWKGYAIYKIINVLTNLIPTNAPCARALSGRTHSFIEETSVSASLARDGSGPSQPREGIQLAYYL